MLRSVSVSRAVSRVCPRVKPITKWNVRYYGNITVLDLLKKRGSSGIISVSDTQSVKYAAQTMEKHKLGSLLVLDSEGRTVGIATARDIQQAVAEFLWEDLPTACVSSVMTPASRRVLFRLPIS